MNFKIINNSSSNIDLNDLVQSLGGFAQKRFGFKKPPSIHFDSDNHNASLPLGKTGFYDPNNLEIHIFVDGRHPKDILRSIAHELVHHTQNEQGSLVNNGYAGEGYAQKNPHLRNMEKDAYERGNMCFRDWEDNYKQKNPTIYTERRSKMSLKEWKNKELGQQLMNRWGFKMNLDGLTEDNKANPLLKEGMGQDAPEWAMIDDNWALEYKVHGLYDKGQDPVFTYRLKSPENAVYQNIIHPVKIPHEEARNEEEIVKAIAADVFKRLPLRSKGAENYAKHLVDHGAKSPDDLVDLLMTPLSQINQKSLAVGRGGFQDRAMAAHAGSPEDYKEWFNTLMENKEITHMCALHVEHKNSGLGGHPIAHTLNENGDVSHYTVEFDSVIVENIPVENLNILQQEEHSHKRDDEKPHDEEKEVVSEEELEEAAKPDYLDLDKDGDKEESMKDAAEDAKDLEEAIFNKIMEILGSEK